MKELEAALTSSNGETEVSQLNVKKMKDFLHISDHELLKSNSRLLNFYTGQASFIETFYIFHYALLS